MKKRGIKTFIDRFARPEFLHKERSSLKHLKDTVGSEPATGQSPVKEDLSFGQQKTILLSDMQNLHLTILGC